MHTVSKCKEATDEKAHTAVLGFRKVLGLLLLALLSPNLPLRLLCVGERGLLALLHRIFLAFGGIAEVN